MTQVGEAPNLKEDIEITDRKDARDFRNENPGQIAFRPRDIGGPGGDGAVVQPSRHRVTALPSGCDAGADLRENPERFSPVLRDLAQEARAAACGVLRTHCD